MRVLIACESSGTVREAFRARGHDAWSNDLLPADDGSHLHIQGDCRDAMRLGWDLIVMHPPCTALCVAGNRTYAPGGQMSPARRAAIRWTLDLWALAKRCAPCVAMENPVGVLPLRPTQYIHPWQHGHGETKKTGLWLHNLPPLLPTDVVAGRVQRVHLMSPGPLRWKLRSKTYDGIALAMAQQWDEKPQMPVPQYKQWDTAQKGENLDLLLY